MQIQIANEAPIDILEDVARYNEYSYALVHLFEENDMYFNFFRSMVLDNNEVYLDNSIFELGEAFDMDRFSYWIGRLDPTWYFVPDALEDKDKTLSNFDTWMTKYAHKHPNNGVIGVVQGRTYEDISECYRELDKNTDMNAISFDYSYYEGLSDAPVCPGNVDEKLWKWCHGRKSLISKLVKMNVWNWSKPHHLLGCSLAREFGFYIRKNVYNIKSVDTSSPVMAAISDIKYLPRVGNYYKPTDKLADHINDKIGKDLRDKIIEYVCRFNEIVNS